MKAERQKLAAKLPWLWSLLIITAGLGGVLALGVADYFTPGPLSFVLFYLVVVVLIGRYVGKWPAVFVSGVAVLTMATVQWGLHRGASQTVREALWNNSTRFLMFSLAGWLTAEVTRLTRHLGDLVEERTAQWKAEVEQHKATSTRLAEALGRFEQVIHNITEVFWLTDVAKNQMVYVSPGYERIWGRKCEELYHEPMSWVAAVHPADRDAVLRCAQTDQATGGYDVEYRIVRPDGAVRWIRDRGFPVRNAQGEVYRIAGIADDITERKQTREMLQTQAAILENMAEGVVVTDDQGVIVQMNPAGERIWGYDRDEVLGQPASVFSALPEPEATAGLREVLAALEATGVWRGTFKNRRKDGAIIFCEAVISRLEVQGRRLMVAVEQDVTERVHAQNLLQMQARVLESMAEAVLVTDENGTIVLTNPAQDTLLGYEPGELMGKSLLAIWGYSPEEYDRAFGQGLEQVKTQGAAAGDFLARRKDGTVIEVETRTSRLNIGGRLCAVVVGQDITQRKQAEQALRQSEETLRVFLDALTEPALLLDREGTILLANRALAKSLSLPEGSLVGHYAFDLIPRPVAETRKAVFDQVLLTRKAVHHEDTRAGRHFVNFECPVLDAAGNVTRVAVLALDITYRKQAESALAKQEELYRTLFELSPDGILLEDAEGNILDVNQALCRSFGYSREELLHQNIRWFVPPERQAEVETHLATLRSGQTLEHEVWNLRKNGERCLMRLNERPLALPDGRQGILVVARDITQSKRAETTKAVFLTLGAKLSSVRTPVEATRAVYAAADQLWKWDSATLSLYSPETDVMESVLFCDVMDGQRREVDLILPPGPPSSRRRRIMREGAELISRKEGDLLEPDVIRFGDVARCSASMMYVPMRRDGLPIGVLSIQSYTPDAFTEEDLRTLQALGDFCAGAMERIRIEHALQQREDSNRAILATAMDGFYTLDFAADPLGAIIEVNEAYSSLTGYSREELLQMRIADLEAEETPEEVARHSASLMAAGSGRFETRHRRKDGRVVDVELSVSRMADRSTRVFAFVRDITERKRSERMKEAFLSLGAKLSVASSPAEAARAVYAAADQLWTWDAGVLDLQALEPGQIETALAYDIVDGQRREVTLPDPMGPATDRMRRVLVQGAELVLRQQDEPATTDTTRFGDTSRLSASIMCVPVRQEGRAVGLLSVQSYTRDAYTREDLQTLQALADYCGGALERLGAEAQRRESEDLLRAFYDSPGGLRGIVELLEDDLLVLSANEPQAAAFGRQVGNMRSVRASELGVTQPTLGLWLAKFRESEQTGAPVTFEYSSDFRAPGTWGLATVSPLKMARTGRLRFGYVAVDITEHKRSELMKEAFLALGAKLSVASSPVEAGRAVYAAADQLWKWDSATLDLCSPESGQQQTVLNCDVVDGRRCEVPQARTGGTPSPRMLRIMREGARLILEDQPATAADFVVFGDTARLSASMMYVPLRREGQAVGVLSIQSYTPNAYTPEDLRTLQALADYCAGALERIRAEAALREAHDQLETRVQERTAELQAANEALQESEQKYRRLHESMTDAFVSTDMSGRITEFNPAYQTLLGYPAGELRKLTYRDLTPKKWHAFEARLVAEQVLSRGYSEVYEKEYRRKDGAIFPVELRTFLVRDARGQPARMWAIVRDITQRKQAEEALREARDKLEARVKERTAELEAVNTALRASEERYRSLVNNLNVGVYRNTPGSRGHFIQANPALARMHGYDSVEEFERVSVADLYQQPGERKQFVADLLRHGSVANYEVHLKKRDGTPIYGSVNATLHRGPKGEVDWIDGMLEDITQRKRAEQALRASEERYRALAESSPDAIFILDRDILVGYVNSTAAKMWKRRPEDLIGLTQRELFPPEVAKYHGKVVAEVFATGKPVRRDELLTLPTGDQWIEIRFVPLYGEQRTVSSVMGVCRDITDRKRAERQLTETLDLNQKMIAASSTGIAAYKASGECVFANEALARTVGGSVSEVLRGNFRRLKSWRASGLLRLAQEALSRGQARQLEAHVATRFGKDVQMDCHLAPFVSNGQPHLLLMVLDITERKRAEGALKQAERLQRAILNNIPDPAWLKDAAGRFLACNQATATFYGRPVEAIVGQTVMDCRPSDAARATQEDEKAMTGRRSVVVEEPHTDSHDRVRWLETIKSPLFNEQNEVIGTVGIARDVTERHRLERQILEISDREQARIGQDIHDGLCQQLVSLAFDANSLESELAREHRPEGRKARRIADFLDQAITETRQLSRGLFPVRLETEGLPPALEELAKATRARFKILCRFESKGPVAVKNATIATHLYRIAQEALANAVKHSRARKVSIRLQAGADQIELRVEDDGTGLSPAKRKKSTGMGLHIMAYRARAIGGTLCLGSSRRGGTIVSCCISRGSR